MVFITKDDWFEITRTITYCWNFIWVTVCLLDHICLLAHSMCQTLRVKWRHNRCGFALTKLMVWQGCLLAVQMVVPVAINSLTTMSLFYLSNSTRSHCRIKQLKTAPLFLLTISWVWNWGRALLGSFMWMKSNSEPCGGMIGTGVRGGLHGWQRMLPVSWTFIQALGGDIPEWWSWDSCISYMITGFRKASALRKPSASAWV